MRRLLALTISVFMSFASISVGEENETFTLGRYSYSLPSSWTEHEEVPESKGVGIKHYRGSDNSVLGGILAVSVIDEPLMSALGEDFSLAASAIQLANSLERNGALTIDYGRMSEQTYWLLCDFDGTFFDMETSIHIISMLSNNEMMTMIYAAPGLSESEQYDELEYILSSIGVE